MKIELRDNGGYQNLKDILLRKDNKTLKIFYGGNGDLYFDIFGSYEENEDNYTAYFEIDEEDVVYPYFKRLVDEIKNANVFTITEDELELCEDDNAVFELTQRKSQRNNELKGNHPHNQLVKDDIIEFYSDSIYNERANRMTMKEIDGKTRLDFFDNPEDEIFGFGIRICNSGSKYMPFNICFMRFFNDIHNYLTQKENNKEKKIGTI